MANTINIPRSHLIMGLCLPVAVLLGYFLAEPLDSASLGVVVFVLVILAVPLLMKWHHALLILSWNAWVNPWFLPGSPSAWMILSFVSLLFAVLNRSVNSDNRFAYIPSLVRPLLFLLAVVFITAFLTGGIGLKSFGAERQGGRGYFFILAAVVGFFAFTSRRIQPERVGLYLGMFFLTSLTPLIGALTGMAGSKLLYLGAMFSLDPPSAYLGAVQSFDYVDSHIPILAYISYGLWCFVLARYGLRGVLDFTKPWRGAMFVLAIAACLASGFRGSVIVPAFTIAILFFLEGLHRTHLLPLCLGIFAAATLAVVPFANKLPTTVQRTLSFLPLGIDPVVKQMAQMSTDWRVEIWKTVVPQVPKYLIKGKGYALDAKDIYMAGFETSAYGATLAGDYHNGPLTLIIPFGIFGVIGFVWFIIAALRYLYHNYLFGDVGLRHANAFLLAVFAAKAIFYFTCYGSFSFDLAIFTGLVGFSVCLNGEPQKQVEEEPLAEALEPAH